MVVYVEDRRVAPRVWSRRNHQQVRTVARHDAGAFYSRDNPVCEGGGCSRVFPEEISRSSQ